MDTNRAGEAEPRPKKEHVERPGMDMGACDVGEQQTGEAGGPWEIGQDRQTGWSQMIQDFVGCGKGLGLNLK